MELTPARAITVRPKAFAYITHGCRLLVFRHVGDPDSGIQVPAGTVEPGESPLDAALREAREETGLDALSPVGLLGRATRDMSDFDIPEIHDRHFFHLRYDGDPPDIWRHAEHLPSTGVPSAIDFEFFWAALPGDVPPLIAGHGQFLPRLIEEFSWERP